MRKEELLKPRYKVIADYPNNEFEIGEILHATKFEKSFVNIFPLEKYPHLFKKLEWWEDRELEDMPMYVKTIYGVLLSIMEYDNRLRWRAITHEGKYIIVSKMQPATEQEYNDYINQKK